MTIFSDISAFLKALSTMDIVFFIAVVVLMLLVIILIYFIKENDNNYDTEINIEAFNNLNTNNNEDNELLDLKKITETLENAKDNTIQLNNYETEQEEKAIISYDELLKHKTDFALNYSEEENIADDLTVKKVDMNNLVNKEVVEKPNFNVQVISYEKEEAFLKALKTLQELLN